MGKERHVYLGLGTERVSFFVAITRKYILFVSFQSVS